MSKTPSTYQRLANNPVQSQTTMVYNAYSCGTCVQNWFVGSILHTLLPYTVFFDGYILQCPGENNVHTCSIFSGGHPYLTGLAIAGGIYCFGLQGAIVGPVLLCCIIVAMNLYSAVINPDTPITPLTPGKIPQYPFQILCVHVFSPIIYMLQSIPWCIFLEFPDTLRRWIWILSGIPVKNCILGTLLTCPICVSKLYPTTSPSSWDMQSQFK